VIRVVVPDLQPIINRYINGEIRSDYFVEHLMVLYPSEKNLIRKLLMPIVSYPHKCMYDTKTLMLILNDIGFNVESKSGMESSIENIEAIEIPDRVKDSVIVEGVKI
jgi:hypothetical protein